MKAKTKLWIIFFTVWILLIAGVLFFTTMFVEYANGENSKNKQFSPSRTSLSSKEKLCFNQCDKIQTSKVQACIDSIEWPLSPCIKKASDNKRQCINQCTGLSKK